MPLGPMPTKSSARYRSRTDVSPLMTAIRTCSSSPATPFWVPPPTCFSCDQAALPNDNVKMRQQIQIRRSSTVSSIPTIAISGEYILASMPLGLLVDHFFEKGGYTPEQLLAKMKELIADSPIRPNLGKADKAPPVDSQDGH